MSRDGNFSTTSVTELMGWHKWGGPIHPYSGIMELDYYPRLGDMQDLLKDAYSRLETGTEAGWKDYSGFIVQHRDYAIKGRYSWTPGPMGLLH